MDRILDTEKALVLLVPSETTDRTLKTESERTLADNMIGSEKWWDCEQGVGVHS